MPISIAQGYSLGSREPLDARLVLETEAARLSLDPFTVYEGMVVYQKNTNELYVLIDTGSWNNSSGWQLVGSGFSGGVSSYIAKGTVTASVNTAADIFLIQSSSNNLLSVTGTGQTTISGSASELFIIKGAYNNPVLTVSQSGVIVFATQSVELTSPAPNGGLYFTSSSFYVGLDS